MQFKKFGRGFTLQLSTNKNIEVEWDDNRAWFWFQTGINTGDHWGFEMFLSLFKYSINFIFYDSRHRSDAE